MKTGESNVVPAFSSITVLIAFILRYKRAYSTITIVY